MKHKTMRRAVTAAVMAILFSGCGMVQAAALYPNPYPLNFSSSAGWSGNWGWTETDGSGNLTTGQMTYIRLPKINSGDCSTATCLYGYTGWSTSLSSPGLISIRTQDDFVPGDEFQLIVDGNLVNWPGGNDPSNYNSTDGGVYYGTSTDPSSGFESDTTFFHGDYLNYKLSAGQHTFSFLVTKVESGYTLQQPIGEAGVSFSTVTPVPAPASVWLFGGGALVLSWLGRKSRRRA